MRLGDQEMHKPGLHYVQLFYFTSFSAAISAPLFLDLKSLDLLSGVLRMPIILCIIIAGSWTLAGNV